MAGTDSDATAQSAPLRLSRIFPAARETVFKAWSSDVHLKRWFCPEMYTVPQATVQMYIGGAFQVCMRGHDGVEHWTRGVFVEVSPPERLVLDLHVVDGEDRPLFRAYTEVSFAEVPGGTRMDVVQTYTLIGPAEAAGMVVGASVGWAQTLDKLAAEIARMQDGGDAQRSVAHVSFHP